MVGFDLALEDLEVLAPEVVQERPQLGQTLGPGSVDASGAVSALTHETGIAQVPQVLGDGLAGDVEVHGDLTRGQFPVADETQDLASPWLGDGIDGCLQRNRDPIILQVDTCASNDLRSGAIAEQGAGG